MCIPSTSWWRPWPARAVQMDAWSDTCRRRRDVVPPRPPAEPTTRPCSRRCRARTRCCPLFVARLRLLSDAGRRPDGAGTSPAACGASTTPLRRRGSCIRARAIRPAGPGRRRPAQVGADAGPHRRRTTARTAPGETSTSRRPCATAGVELVRTGSPYAVAAGPGHEPAAGGRTRSSRRSRPGVAPTTAGAHPARRATASRWLPRLTPSSPCRSRRRTDAPGSRARTGATPAPGTAGSWTDRVRDYADAARPPGPRHARRGMSVAPEVRRDLTRGTMLEASPPAEARRGTYRTAAAPGASCCADVLARTTPTRPASCYGPAFAADGVRRTSRRAASTRGAQGRTGLPDRGRRHAAAARPTGCMHNRVRMIVASASW